mmetsp:Transcript_24045/g.67753  ORF Transcript_24045/g.67753 Transcript_24045/m.67753 type:complete len:317 (+) Transcript_24045:114-1064(+)
MACLSFVRSNPDMANMFTREALPWSSAIVWPCMLALPLAMTLPSSPLRYDIIFPKTWYEYDFDSQERPKPLGLCLGITAVAIGQVLLWVVFYAYKYGHLSFGKEPTSIQTKGPRPYEFDEGILSHIAQPEGFVLLGGYLAVTWMFRLLPAPYYSFEGGIDYGKTFLCLAIQDVLQYAMHRMEHSISPTFYQNSHKPHHKFTNPRLFDAFNGSMADTIIMILIPLYATANLVHINVWTYMAFGSMYANWLTLIHAEYTFPWDDILFHPLGFGTPADHHVHHAFFKFNYGHLFMWSDMVCGTYRHPNMFAPKKFNKNV